MPARKPHVNGTKHCPKCDTWKPLVEFTRDVKTWDRLAGVCAICNGRAVRASYVKRTYGITLEKYHELLAGPCAICESTTRKMHLDHDHSTGQLRGALCANCNRGLGLLGDTEINIRRALEYLA